MSISQKLVPIKCDKDLVSDRFRHLASSISNFKVCRFLIGDWASSWGVSRLNEASFTELLKQYMKSTGFYLDDNFTLANIYDSDISDEDYIIVLYNDSYFGILTTCCDLDEMLGIYEEILSNLNPKITPVKIVSSKDDNITPLQFLAYEV